MQKQIISKKDEKREEKLQAFDRIRWVCGGLQKEGGLEGLHPHLGGVSRAYVIGREAANFAVGLGSAVEAEVCTRTWEKSCPNNDQIAVDTTISSDFGQVPTVQILSIKEITGIGESLAGRLLLYDALSARFQTIRSRGK